jgi:phosphate-selective porin OprO/OprP
MKKSFKIGLLVLIILSTGNLLKGQTHVITSESSDSVRYNAYGMVVTRKAAIPEYRNGILTFESANQNLRTWFDLRVNFDGAYYFDKNALNPLGSGVTIRRLRFAMKTILYKHWTGEVDLNFAGGGLDVKDAFIGYLDDENSFYVKAGYFKEPISMETTTTSRYQTFIEEPYMTTFAPQRQLGINISKWNQHYLAVAGVHFQDVENLEVTTYSENVNKANGTDEGISYTGKLIIRPISENHKVIHIGAAASYRTPKTSWEFPNTYRLSTRDMTSISRKKFLDTDDISNVKNYTIYAGELAAASNNFKFSSEYIYSKINRDEGFKSYQHSGTYASIAWLIFGGKYNYNEAEGEFTQVSQGKDWGDIEVALRYDYINLNDKNAEIMGGSANGFTGGINYYVNQSVKFMLNYSYINHDRYASGKGKLFVGHDADGNLTTNYSKVTEQAGKGGDDYGFIQARVEIDF